MDWRKLGSVPRCVLLRGVLRRPTKIMVFTLALFFAGAINIPAQQSSVIIRKLTLNQVSDIISNQGWPVSKEDDRSILTKFEGSSVRIAIDKTGETLMVIAVIKHNPASMTPQKINEFNELLFGDAATFVYQTNFIFVSSLGLEGGVTRDRVVNFLKSARDAFEIWDESFGL